ncbi:MAG: alpha/beta fold hydrolase [Kineosporiaceae bacterium]
MGDVGFAQQLRDLGPPPYTDTLASPVAISSNPEWDDYTRGADYVPQASYPTSLFTSEYTFTESMRGMGALADTFAAMYPQLQEVDFRRDVPRMEVPVYVVQGVHEAAGRADLAEEWFAGLRSPSKLLVRFDSSGHTPHLDEPGRFADFMAEVVLEQTRAGG